jgi:BioD-like phosphotransacetylase family protein
MPVLQVLSTGNRSGKTTVAAGLARGFAQRGHAVRLARLGSGENAVEDATTFATFLFAASTGTPVVPGAISSAKGEVAVVELEAGSRPLDAPAVIVVHRDSNTEDEALARSLGANLAGTIATAVPPAETDAVAGRITDGGMRVLAIIPEDPVLAAPSVASIREALAADVLYAGENMAEPIANVLVAPVYTDGAKVHFRRFDGTRAVLTPSYKTDLLLAAIESAADCVIVTGGHQPSLYVIDRVQGMPTTLLLAQQQTPAAVTAMSDVWGSSAFAGEAKSDAIAALLDSRIEWDALFKKLQ